MAHSANGTPPSRSRALLYCISAIVLVVLNVILFISSKGKGLEGLAQQFTEALWAIDPFHLLSYLYRVITRLYAPWTWCIGNDRLCLMARTRETDALIAEFLSSFTVLSFILFAVALALAGFIWVLMDEPPGLIGFSLVILVATAIVFVLRLLLIGFALVLGGVVGFVFWINSAFITMLTLFMHGRELWHSLRHAKDAVQEARETFRQPPPS